MKLIKIYIVVLLWFAAENRLHAQLVNDSVFNKTISEKFRLVNTVSGKTTTLEKVVPANTLLLFIFISPDCPICISYTPALNALRQRYAESVKMIGIIPGRTYSAAAVNAFTRKHKILFPVLIDKKKEISNYLRAAITPEVILLNNRFELVYRGAIDNSVTQLGGLKSSHATEKYLENAISHYLQHSSITLKRVKAVGCRINDF